MIQGPSDQLQAYFAGLPAPSQHTVASAEVRETQELQRIRDTVRVDWNTPDLEALTDALTRYLKTPEGTQRLRTIQTGALRGAYEQGGVFLPIRTSGGKTLISFLAPEIMLAQRPLLIVPAKLINSGKTHRDHTRARQHWKLRPLLAAKASKARVFQAPNTIAPLRVVSYEALGRVDYVDALQNWNPDVLVLDEAHKAKDIGTSVTKNLSKYIRQNHPRLVVLSGSPTNRKIAEYAHILRWIFGKNTPLPNDWHELQQWGFALDEKVHDGSRVAPGALLQLSPPDPEDDKNAPPDEDAAARQGARRRYGRRLRSWPGVVGSGYDLPGISLTARVQKLEPDAAMIAAVNHLRKHWETPCGHPFEMATQLWAHEREISCGFYYRWNVQPPPEWLAARRDWSAFVRDVLSRSRTLFSKLAVAQAVDAGKIDDGGLLERWRGVKPLFVPKEHQEAVWLSDQTVNWCAEWLHREKGICWVQHKEFGERLSKVSKVPYFAAGAKCGSVAIDTHHGPAIASISAVNEGFNLQELHCHNLVSTTPTTNRQNEQLISRTHRDDSVFDEVTVLYLQTLEGDQKALDQARADAVNVEATMMQPQRLNAASWIDE